MNRRNFLITAIGAPLAAKLLPEPVLVKAGDTLSVKQGIKAGASMPGLQIPFYTSPYCPDDVVYLVPKVPKYYMIGEGKDEGIRLRPAETISYDPATGRGVVLESYLTT